MTLQDALALKLATSSLIFFQCPYMTPDMQAQVYDAERIIAAHAHRMTGWDFRQMSHVAPYTNGARGQAVDVINAASGNPPPRAASSEPSFHYPQSKASLP